MERLEGGEDHPVFPTGISAVCSYPSVGARKHPRILLEKCGKSSTLKYNHSSKRKGFFSSAALKLTGTQFFSC